MGKGAVGGPTHIERRPNRKRKSRTPYTRAGLVRVTNLLTGEQYTERPLSPSEFRKIVTD